MTQYIRLWIPLLVLACGATAQAADVLVWQPTHGGYETHWVEVNGDEVKTVATRGEAVVSDGKALWGLRFHRQAVELRPCEAMEDPKIGPEGAFAWPSLKAVPLASGTPHDIVKGHGEGAFFGEIWGKEIHLVGGAGPYVMIDHADSGYGCGAHGYVDNHMFVWNAVEGAQAEPKSLMRDEATFRKTPVRDLVQRAVKEECVSDPEAAPGQVYLDGLSLKASDGAVEALATYVHPTEADWQFACTIDHTVPVPEGQRAPALATSEAVRKALKSLNAEGTVGFAVLALEGDARNAALTAFKAALPTPAPLRLTKRDATPYINRGRKLTKGGNYAAAIREFDTAIRIDPLAARAWSGRGYAKQQAGDLAAATRDFDHALTLDAEPAFHAAIWFNLGQIAEKRGKMPQARRAYDKAKALKGGK